MCFTTSRERKIVKYECVISLNSTLVHLKLLILSYIYLILKLVRNFFKSGLEKASVVRRLDNAIHWINCHTAERIECFVNTYQLVSNLSGGKRYPAFEKPRPEV